MQTWQKRTRTTMWGCLLAVLGVLAGCGSYPTAEVAADEPGVAEPAESDASAKAAVATEALEALVVDYLEALLAHDGPAVRKLVSTEARERATAWMTARGLDETAGWKALTVVEGGKAERRFGDAQAIGSGFAVTAAAERAGGAVVALTMAFDGVELPKPMWVVYENGQPRLSILPPATRSEHDYRVDSTASTAETVGCDGASSIEVPAGSSRDITCTDTCGIWAGSGFYDGDNYSIGDCDYNTWGYDVLISDTDISCHDSC